MLLIDSSAIVKFFSKETGWEKVKNYISESLTIKLAIAELSSALSRKVRKNEMKENTALEFLDDYSANAILLDETKYVSYAFKLAIARNISVYDSLFITVAAQEGYDLVSCDGRQIRVANSIGVKTINC